MFKKDVTGRKFGKLTAIKYSHSEKCNGKTKAFWLYKCDCGKEIVIKKDHIVCGKSSCGCDIKINRATRATKHSMYGTRFYKIWTNIQSRCTNKKVPAYKRYGGRGIICVWKSFLDFKDDMYELYLTHEKEFGTKNTTIDRINNDGNYCKENCRWSSMKEQANNRVYTRGGIHNNMAKLTESDVLSIMGLLKKNKLSHAKIGKKFNVSPASVYSISKGNAWNYLTRIK